MPSNVEERALALFNEVVIERDLNAMDGLCREDFSAIEALCRAVLTIADAMIARAALKDTRHDADA